MINGLGFKGDGFRKYGLRIYHLGLEDLEGVSQRLKRVLSSFDSEYHMYLPKIYIGLHGVRGMRYIGTWSLRGYAFLQGAFQGRLKPCKVAVEVQ